MRAAASICLHLYGSLRAAETVGFTFLNHYNAFMDAAGKPEHGSDGWCVVAGFFSTVPQWDEFESAWNALLDGYSIAYLQMSSLHARKGIFDNPKWDDEKYMIGFLSEAGKLVRSSVLKWAVDLVNYGDFEKAVNTVPELEKYTNAYGLCGTAVSLRLQSERIWENFPSRLSIEHFFEEGDVGINNIEQVFARCGMQRPIVRPGKPRASNPEMKYYVHFQAADWLAFETRKMVMKYGDSEPLMRESLRALLKGVPGEAKKWTYDDLITFSAIKRKRGQM